MWDVSTAVTATAWPEEMWQEDLGKLCFLQLGAWAITAEWSSTELWCEGTGQLLIYGAQGYCQGITLSSLSVFPSMGSLPIPEAQHRVLSSSRAVLGHFCSHKPHTEHQTQPLLTPRDCSKGSFPFHLPPPAVLCCV